MIMVPMKAMKISFEFTLGIEVGFVLLGLLQFKGIAATLVALTNTKMKAVSRHFNSRNERGAMEQDTYMTRVPVTHALPAKMMTALRARHVVTSPILFDPVRALGALFGIHQHPMGCFRLVLTLLVPPLE